MALSFVASTKINTVNICSIYIGHVALGSKDRETDMVAVEGMETC